MAVLWQRPQAHPQPPCTCCNTAIWVPAHVQCRKEYLKLLAASELTSCSCRWHCPQHFGHGCGDAHRGRGSSPGPDGQQPRGPAFGRRCTTQPRAPHAALAGTVLCALASIYLLSGLLRSRGPLVQAQPQAPGAKAIEKVRLQLVHPRTPPSIEDHSVKEDIRSVNTVWLCHWQSQTEQGKTRSPQLCNSAASWVAIAGTLVGLPAAAMAEQSNNTDTARAASRALVSVLTHTRANARLDAVCTSTLCVSDLGNAYAMLQPLFTIRDRLMNRESVQLDEALFFLHETEFCELLLSLLRRWPWAEMRQTRAEAHEGLALLPKVLSTVCLPFCVWRHKCAAAKWRQRTRS